MPRMSWISVRSWVAQSIVGVCGIIALSFVLGAAAPAEQATGKGVSANGGCEPGYSGSPETGCVDVNECAVSNGGCHRMTACENTPGGRSCGGCPKDYVGDGYLGCFDVNDCGTTDCSDRLPTAQESAPAPAVTTSGDVTVAATSAEGVAATFTATAKDSIDGTRPVNCSPASGSVFKVGKTTVTCWAFNRRGKIGRSTLNVTVTK